MRPRATGAAARRVSELAWFFPSRYSLLAAARPAPEIRAVPASGRFPAAFIARHRELFGLPPEPGRSIAGAGHANLTTSGDRIGDRPIKSTEGDGKPTYHA